MTRRELLNDLIIKYRKASEEYDITRTIANKEDEAVCSAMRRYEVCIEANETADKVEAAWKSWRESADRALSAKREEVVANVASSKAYKALHAEKLAFEMMSEDTPTDTKCR